MVSRRMPESPIPRPGALQLAYWQAQNPAPGCFVYVIRPKGDTPIKVGKAEDVVKRMGELQTGNPRELTLLHVLVGYGELEAQLHRRLRPSRVRGEWFEGDSVPGFLRFVEALAENMVRFHQNTGDLPHWKDFGDWHPQVAYEAIRAVKVAAPELNESIVRGHIFEAKWSPICPECHEPVSLVSEPESLDPAWHPGTVRCSANHCWTFTEARNKASKKRPTTFYLTGPA